MIFHENRLLADDDNSHNISYLTFVQNFGKMLQNLPSAAVVIGALRVYSLHVRLFSMSVCFCRFFLFQN